MPKRPKTPRAWAGCLRCKTNWILFRSLEAANKWLYEHEGSARDLGLPKWWRNSMLCAAQRLPESLRIRSKGITFAKATIRSDPLKRFQQRMA